MNGEYFRRYAAIGLILIIALVLRILGLNEQLWYDEISTLVEFIRRPAAELFVVYGSLNNHLAYTWLAKLTTAIFGEVAWALRLPAAVFGVASIWATWALLREVGLKQVALITAALLAVSFHHVWFSQNARGYTGLLLFTSLSGLFMLRGLKENRTTDWLYYAVFSGAALIMHLTAAFLLTAQGLTALLFGYRAIFLRKKTSFQHWIRGPLIGFGGAIFIALVIYAPMIPSMIETFGTYNTQVEPNKGTGVEAWHNPLWTLLEIGASFGGIGAAIPLALVFASVGAFRLWRASPLVAAPFLIHIPLTLIVLIATSFRIWPRYFFVDIGFLLAAVVYGAFWFADITEKLLPRLRAFGLSAQSMKLIGSAFMIIASVPLLMNNYKGPKQDFEGARDFIEMENPQNDLVIVVGLAKLPFTDYATPHWPHAQTIAQFEALTARKDPIWVVAAFPSHLEGTYPQIAARLDQDYERIRTFPGTLSGGETVVYRSHIP